MRSLQCEQSLDALHPRIARIDQLIDAANILRDLDVFPFDVIGIDIKRQAVVKEAALLADLVIPQPVGGERGRQRRIAKEEIRPTRPETRRHPPIQHHIFRDMQAWVDEVGRHPLTGCGGMKRRRAINELTGGGIIGRAKAQPPDVRRIDLILMAVTHAQRQIKDLAEIAGDIAKTGGFLIGAGQITVERIGVIRCRHIAVRTG